MNLYHLSGLIRANLLRFLLFVVLLTVALARANVSYAQTQPTTQAGQTSRGFFPLGTPTELYGFVVTPSATTPQSFQTFILRRTLETARWQHYARVENIIVDATPYQNGLAVLFASGTWRRVIEDDSFTGVPLPVGYRILDLAGNSRDLFAIARSGNGPVELFRLGGSNWVLQGPVPLANPNSPSDLILMVQSGVSRLYVASYEAGQVVIHSTSPASQATTQPIELTWSQTAAFTPIGAVGALRLLDLDGNLAIWTDPGLADGGAVYFASKDFSPAQRLSIGSHNGELAVSGNRIRFFFAKDDAERGPMYEAVYDFSGTQLGQPQETALPLLSAFQTLIQNVTQGILMAGVLLAVVLSWRTRSRISPEQLEFAYTLPLAPYVKRALAAAVDLSPCIVIGLLIYYRYSPGIDDLLTNPMILILEVFAVAVVITHTLLSELIFGRTLGKALVGLRVAGINGQRATPTAILLRNIFKIVEIAFPLIWISIFLSPLRQSLSDSVAGTLVLDTSANTGQVDNV